MTWLLHDPRWAGVREDVMSVGGHPVRVLRADSTGGTEPQLLVHGLGGSAVNWIDVIGPLSRFGPVVAVDLPGFGGTAVLEGGHAGVEANADFVLAVADALGWDRFSLHGNSMGGLIAALAAAEAPERVSRLALVSPALPPRGPSEGIPLPWPTAIGALPLALPVVGAAAAEHTLGRPGPDGEVAVDGQALIELLFHNARALRPALLQALATDAAVSRLRPRAERARELSNVTRSLTRLWLDPRLAHDAVARVSSPTLVVAGGADRLIHARSFESLGRRRPEWTVWIASDAGHVLMLEQPRRYLDVFAGWRAAEDGTHAPIARSA